MRSKILVVALVALLISSLVGCGVVTPATDEAKIKSVINEYFLATSNQNWSKAKSCCLYGSERYHATCQAEAIINSLYAYCNIVTVNIYADILSVSIYGGQGEVYLYLIGLVTACGYYDSDSGYTNYYLQKIGDSWKIYAKEE